LFPGIGLSRAKNYEELLASSLLEFIPNPD
jgi:hypothetical protein